jgi:hypothetical protein
VDKRAREAADASRDTGKAASPESWKRSVTSAGQLVHPAEDDHPPVGEHGRHHVQGRLDLEATPVDPHLGERRRERPAELAQDFLVRTLARGDELRLALPRPGEGLDEVVARRRADAEREDARPRPVVRTSSITASVLLTSPSVMTKT